MEYTSIRVFMAHKSLKKKDLRIFAARKKMLLYYLKTAKSDYAKEYFLGRLDELKRLKRELSGK